MNEIDEQLNNILELEADNKNISGWLGERGNITKTAEIRKLITIDEHLGSKTLKPDKIGGILIGIFLLSIPGMFLIQAFINKSSSIGGYIAALMFLGLILISFIIEKNNKRLNYTITLSKEGIAYDETLYQWTDIKETAYLRLRIGKNGKTYLILLFNNNNGYDIWELANFQSFYPSFTTKLANYIEHFKSNQ